MAIDTPHVTESPDTMKEFATTLRKARKDAGLSQSQAAKRCNCPVKTFQNWEQRVAKPSAIVQEFVIKKLAEG